MNAKHIMLAMAVATLFSSTGAFAQPVQITGPATVTSQSVQLTGTPSCVSNGTTILNSAAVLERPRLLGRQNVLSYPAVINDGPLPRNLVSREPAIDFNLWKFGFGFGRVLRDWDNR